MKSSHSWKTGLAVAGVLLGTSALVPAFAQTPAAGTSTTQAARENQKVGDWLHVNRDYANNRYSPLDQINAGNIKKLQLAYTFAIEGLDGGGSRYANASLEGTPSAEDGFLYVTNGWGTLYKLDAKSRSQAKPLWKMDPQVDKPWAGDVACCGINNRGVALWNDKVISITLDGRLIATNKASGEIVWQTKDADPAKGETLTVAPQVVRDMGIIGPAGAEYGIRGWVDGIDLNTGKRAWRTWTVAGEDDPNAKSWGGKTNQTGGGSIWQTGSYDPAVNLTYWGTGNPGPDFDAEYRPGDNLYTDSVIALNPDNGKMNWYFQYTPNDPFDYDEIGVHALVDVTINGQARKVVYHAGRNGYFYGFDRTNGQFLYGAQYTDHMNWTNGLDPKTGKPVAYDPTKQIQNYGGPAVMQNRAGNVGTVCPVHTGGMNWEPSAYSPRANLIYVAGGEGCNQHVTKAETGPADQGGTWKLRDRFVGSNTVPPNSAPANPAWTLNTYGSLAAIDPATGKTVKKIKLDHVNRAGVTAFMGGFVMGGEPNGWLRAYDDKTLDKLWEFNVGSAIKAPPMSYMADGVQYIAVEVGAAVGSNDIRINPSVASFTPAYQLYVFRLDEDLLPKRN